MDDFEFYVDPEFMCKLSECAEIQKEEVVDKSNAPKTFKLQEQLKAEGKIKRTVKDYIEFFKDCKDVSKMIDDDPSCDRKVAWETSFGDKTYDDILVILGNIKKYFPDILVILGNIKKYFPDRYALAVKEPHENQYDLNEVRAVFTEIYWKLPIDPPDGETLDEYLERLRKTCEEGLDY